MSIRDARQGVLILPGRIRRGLLATFLVLLVAGWLRDSAQAAGTLEPASIKETVFPNGLRLLIKEAGHSPHLSHPVPVTEAAVAFLAELA